MIPAVVLALVLVTPAFSLPVTSQEFQTGSIQTPQALIHNDGVINQQGTVTGEKTGTDGILTCVEKIQNQGSSSVGETVQQVIPQVQPSIPVRYSESQTVPQAEKTGVQVPHEGTHTSHQYLANYPQNSPTSKGENVLANFQHNQPFQTQSQVSLPVQPFTVAPVNQVGEILRPVTAPVETVDAGRMIIMPIEPIQQRNFQGGTATPENKVPYQQVVQPVIYSVGQVQGFEQTPAFTVQPVEKQDIQTASQTYVPVQSQLNQGPDVQGQVVHQLKVVRQPIEPVQVYNPATAAEPNPQIYNVQPNSHFIIGEYVDKQTPQQSTRSTTQQTQFVQPTFQQDYSTQQSVEKKGGFQQVVGHIPAQNQEVQPLYQQQEYPVIIESVQSYQPNQQNENPFQKQTFDSILQQEQILGDQQPTERQTPIQQSSDYVPDQNQLLVQQVYTVQSENHQNQIPVQSQPVQQQIYSAQPEYLQNHTPVQPQPVQQVENVYHAVEKQKPVLQEQQSVQFSQVSPEAPVQPLEQFSNVRPLVVSQAKGQPSKQSVQPENTVYVSQQQNKNSPVQSSQQVFVAQPEQAVDHFAKPVYNFEGVVPQSASVHENTSVHVLSAVEQNQGQPVNPSAVSPQV